MEMQKLSLTQLAPTHSLHFYSPSYQNRKLFSPERITRNPMSNVLHKANLAALRLLQQNKKTCFLKSMVRTRASSTASSALFSDQIQHRIYLHRLKCLTRINRAIFALLAVLWIGILPKRINLLNWVSF
jgi:hypothetical protein